MAKSKNEARERRKRHIQKKIRGSVERPRLTVFKSLKHIYAQVINDEDGCTLVSSSTLSPTLVAELKGLSKKEKAKKVGLVLGKICLENKIEKVVFDRNGYLYHGRVAALADGAREAGLRF